MVSLSTPKYLDVTQRSPEVVWLMLGPHHGDSHTQGSRCGGRAFKEGKGVPRVDDLGVAMGVTVEGASVGTSPRVSRGAGLLFSELVSVSL